MRLFSLSFCFVATFLLFGSSFGLFQSVAIQVAESTIVSEPLVAKFLYEGRLGDGETQLKQHLSRHPDDDQARLGLGILKFLRAAEHLGQQLYSHGKLDKSSSLLNDMPFFRFPVPENPDPQPVSLADIRMSLEAILAHVEEAAEVLAGVSDDEVTLTLDLAKIHD